MEVLNELCDLVAAHPDLLLADKLTWLSSRCAPPAAAPRASRAHLHSLIALARLLPAAPAPVPHLPGFPRLPVAVLLAAVLRPHALPLRAPPPSRRRARLPRPLVRPLHRPPRRARRCRPRLPHGRVVPLNVRRDPTLLKFEDLGAIASNGVNGSRKSCSGGTCTSGSGIQGDFNLNNFEDGVLSSAFMIGLLVASPIFASLAKIHNPFRLIGVGLLIWTIATAGCGCSFDFWSITIRRMLVGVGEASFISLAAPFIDDSVVRIGLPSKGRMSEQTLSLLKVPNLEVWFQRPTDIVRKLQSGDLDLGIVGFDIVSEYGQMNLGRTEG